MILLILGLISYSHAVARPSWDGIYTKTSRIAKGWKYIIIHHSGTNAGSAEAFHRHHTKMGYGGLCYHFVIGNGHGMPDGKVVAGFRWKEQIIGTHVDVNSWYHNIFGIGICLVGNFNQTPPTAKQMEALNALIKKLMREHDIPAANVIGHNQVPHGKIKWDARKIRVSFEPNRFAATVCPGKKFPMEKVISGL